MKNRIISYLEELYPDAKCELNYNKDYELLIATVLSAQTTDISVNKVTSVLFSKYDSLNALYEADIDDIKKIIRTIGTFNKKAQYIHDIAFKLRDIGYVPNDREFLESLSGVGRKTVNVVLSNIYNEPYLAVDTHVKRVSNRLGLTNSDDPSIVESDLMKILPKEKIVKLHHQFIFFGRYHCKSKNPNCNNCKLIDICKYKNKNLTM